MPEKIDLLMVALGSRCVICEAQANLAKVDDLIFVAGEYGHVVNKLSCQKEDETYNFISNMLPIFDATEVYKQVLPF